MSDNWFKENFAKIFRKRKAGLVSSVSPVPGEPIIREREPTKDELALGWAVGIDEETDAQVIQMKGMSQQDRDRHFYIVGGSGFGKSKFLESLIIQDIKNKEGFGVIDAHGDLVENIKGWLYFAKRELGKDLEKQVILIEPTNPNSTVCFNPLERIKGGRQKIQAEQQAGELLKVFEKIWHESWGSRMEDIMRNSLIALVENNLTLAELPLLLNNELVRRKILKKVKNPTCQQRFEFFNNLPKHTWREWTESTLNKVNAFLSDPRIRTMLSNPKSSFNLREVIDSKKVLLVNLDKGQLKGSSDLLGALLLSKIQMTAFTRTDTAKEKRAQFYLYIDEFQNFATKSFIDTLSEARKYKLSLILAHQNLAQLPKELLSSILANCGIQACFHVSREDAQVLAKEMLVPLYASPPGWEFNVQDLQGLGSQQCFIRNTKRGGVVLIEVPDTPDPWKLSALANGEFNGITEESFRETVNNQNIGKYYLRGRKKIESAHKRSMENFTTAPEPERFREPKQTQEPNNFRKKINRPAIA
jgi:hypothetical protein